MTKICLHLQSKIFAAKTEAVRILSLFLLQIMHFPKPWFDGLPKSHHACSITCHHLQGSKQPSWFSIFLWPNPESGKQAEVL